MADSITLTQLTKMVSQKTGYNTKDCYEVLRATFDLMGDLLANGEKIMISRLFSIYFDTGVRYNPLTNGMAPYMRPHLKIADALRKRSKEDK